MPLTDAGALVFTKSIIAESVNLFNAANSRLAVGNGTTAFVKTQTALQGASQFRKLVDAAPARTGGTIRFTATFNPGEGSFDWNEWAPMNAASAGDMLSRKVESPSLGNKPAGETWQLVADCAVSAQ